MAPIAAPMDHAVDDKRTATAAVSSSEPLSTRTAAAAAETKQLRRGVYTPVLTFFRADAHESLDLDTFSTHVKWIAAAGGAGIVVLGSTGERVALSEQERIQLIRTARTALDQAGFGHLPLIAGAGGHSVQLAIQSVHAAHAAGASHVLVLPSSYYPAQIGRPGAREFYTQLADSSPVPILIYSYPGVSAGIDLDSELVADLAHHPNIRGVKHTDHNIGKMARHCALPSAADADAASFFVLGGASDYYIGALAVGAHGTITGMGNIAPRAVVRLQQLWDQGKYEEARSLQGLVSVAEWELGKGGVPMHKALVVATRGYGGAPRRPLQPSAKAAVAQAERGFAALMQLERKLEREA